MDVKEITVHCVEIEDRPGALQEFLSKAAAANVDFQCIAAYSTGGPCGNLCVSAKDSESFAAFARQAGIDTSKAAGFMVCGEDKVGAAADALKGLAEANINGIAGTAMVFEGQYQMLVVVDAADAEAACKAMSAQPVSRS